VDRLITFDERAAITECYWAVRLYLQETLTFLMLTSESAVALAPRATTPPT
jgi:hypothetical protein